MAIYDIFKESKRECAALVDNPVRQEKEQPQIDVPEEIASPQSGRDRFLSKLFARLFFFLLLLGDVLWTAYALFLFLFAAIGTLLTAKKVRYFTHLKETAWISLRRALVCGISLFLALFSPAFGIMVACSYFLMYDKAGIEEVIPSSLQAQFREFMPH